MMTLPEQIAANLGQIKLLALDLDDTLLRSDGTISAETLATLLCWRSMGNHIVVATGRPPRAVAEVLPESLWDVPWICYNGAEVQERGEILKQDLIPVGDARQIVSWAQTELPDWRMGVEIGNRLYLNRPPEKVRPHLLAPDLLEVISEPVAKILFFASPVPNRTHSELDGFDVFGPLLRLLPATTRSMHSNRYRLLQFMSGTADKAYALRFVADRLGLAMEQVMAFGDDVNDVEMVRQSGTGVAVDNAVPEVHAVADWVTASHDQEGVGIMLESLIAAHRAAR